MKPWLHTPLSLPTSPYQQLRFQPSIAPGPVPPLLTRLAMAHRVLVYTWALRFLAIRRLLRLDGLLHVRGQQQGDGVDEQEAVDAGLELHQPGRQHVQHDRHLPAQSRYSAYTK